MGLRYTYEDKQGTYLTQVFGGADLTGVPPATAAELTRAKLSIFRPQNYRAASDDGSLSGRLNLFYEITDDVLTYVSYAHGYKSGGLNMSGLPLDALNQPALGTVVIKDEKNSTLELGGEEHAARRARHGEPRRISHAREGLSGEHRLEPGDCGHSLVSGERARSARAGCGG